MRNLPLSLVLLAALVAAPMDLLAHRPPRRFALVVGVREYRPQQKLPTLHYTESDAHRLADVLKKSDYEVTLMTQQAAEGEGNRRFQPNSDFIRDEFEALVGAPFLREDDCLLVALAGHGVQFDSKQAAGKSTFYFCPADAAIRDLKFSEDVKDRHHLLSVDELYATLKKSKAGVKLLLVDACRNDPSRSAGLRAANSITMPKIPPPPGGMAAYFSCSARQMAYEDATLKHGVFFHYVLEALSGKADFIKKDGLVTVTELKEYVGDRVYNFVRRKHSARQLPDFKGEIRGAAPILKIGRQSFAESIGIKLVAIPAGEFQMGSPDSEDAASDEKPQHRVRIAKPFLLAAHEVTVGQFRQFVNDTGYKTEAETDGTGGYGWNETTGKVEGRDTKYNWRNTGFSQRDDHPVVNVTWNDAVEFCEWLSRKDGRTYRLPSEAEWEYACRAGTKTRYHSGEDAETLVRVGNLADGTAKKRYPDWTTIAAEDGHVFTAPVGSYRANVWGLYDMHGNVWEWCSDWYASDYYKNSPLTDSKGPNTGSIRVLRGGSWFHTARNCRSAYRDRRTPVNRTNGLGFRVAAVQ